MQRLASEPIHRAGAGMSDAIRLGQRNLGRDGWPTFAQVGTGGELGAPFKRERPALAEPFAPAPDLLHRAIGARNERHRAFVIAERGGPPSPDSASQWLAPSARKRERRRDGAWAAEIEGDRLGGGRRRSPRPVA